MSLNTSIRIAIAAFVVAGVVAPAGLATGEPKNEWPFTRPAGERATAAAPLTSTTNPRAGYGEPKNELPFTRPVGEPAIVVKSSTTFDWGDAGIGAGAMLGLVTAGLGAFVLVRTQGRRPRATRA